MAELVPHPLVTSVALKLGGELEEGDFKQSAEDLLDATGKSRSRGDDAAFTAATAPDDQFGDQKNALAGVFANQANIAGLSLFAGYLGGPVDHDGAWRLVYLDARLTDWMLVPETAIIAFQRLPDANSPSGVRDVLWVDSTANLVRGSGPRANEGRFLVGELTRAGDFAASTSGGTFSAASGLLCEALTPGCCVYTRTRC